MQIVGDFHDAGNGDARRDAPQIDRDCHGAFGKVATEAVGIAQRKARRRIALHRDLHCLSESDTQRSEFHFLVRNSNPQAGFPDFACPTRGPRAEALWAFFLALHALRRVFGLPQTLLGFDTDPLYPVRRHNDS